MRCRGESNRYTFSSLVLLPCFLHSAIQTYVNVLLCASVGGNALRTWLTVSLNPSHTVVQILCGCLPIRLQGLTRHIYLLRRAEKNLVRKLMRNSSSLVSSHDPLAHSAIDPSPLASHETNLSHWQWDYRSLKTLLIACRLIIFH